MEIVLFFENLHENINIMHAIMLHSHRFLPPKSKKFIFHGTVFFNGCEIGQMRKAWEFVDHDSQFFYFCQLDCTNPLTHQTQKG